MSEQFKYLFTPTKIGSVELRNRIVCLPHGTGFVQDSRVTETLVNYLADRARGGAGLIIASGNIAHPTCQVQGGW